MGSSDLNGKFVTATSGNNTDAVLIQTARLTIREIEDSDIDAFRKITTQPGFYYYCFDGTEEKLEAFIEKAKETRTPNPATGMRDAFMLAVTLKDTGEVIGHTNILRIEEYTLPVTGIDYEAAYFIGNDFQGKGLGPEALVNTMHYGFAQLGLPGYGSMQELDNEVAIKLASNVLGFKKIAEGIGQTTKGPKMHQICIVTPDDFYAIRATEKRPYILPDSGNAGGAPKLDLPKAAP